MLKVILTFILFTCSLYAQNLYDSNCLKFVQTNELVKAKSDKDYILANKRTERYFYWEKINDKYKNISTDSDLLAQAKRRYQYSDKQTQINNCKGDLQSCNSYKAYCIEELATKGMSEEVNEWNDRVKNCMSQKYRELHPNFCNKDFKRSLLYLKNMASKLAKTNKNKSLEVAMFFNEAKETFQKHYNEMDNLLASIKKQKEKEKANELHAINKSKVQNSLDICRDLIKADDNDIGSKMYIDKLLVNYSCQSMDIASELNPQALSSLEKVMSDIDFKAQERRLFPQVTNLAMNKSVKATAATYMKFFKEDLNLDDSNSKHKFVKGLCAKLDEDYCKKPAIKASMYKALNELYTETKNNPIQKISQLELKADTKRFNSALTDANSLCGEIKKKASSIKSNNKCSNGLDYLDSVEKQSKIGQELILECKKIKTAKFAALKKLEDSYQDQALNYYSTATSTISGHLLVTEDFRDKVNLPSKRWVKDRCIYGDGEAFNKVSDKDVSKGLKDFYNLNLQEISDISKQKRNPHNQKAIIKDYLKNNPSTIVDLLNNNPNEDYAKAICGFVREINSDDYVKVVFERAAIGVGVVAGVALSITGIGSPVGVPLLAAVGTATAAEAGVIIYDINDINYNKQNIAQAASTNQINNHQAITETLSAEDQVYSRKVDLALALSFGTLDIATESFKSAKLLYKSADAIKAKKILGVTKAITDESAKRISIDITSGFENFSYYAKKNKLNAQSIKDLTDAQKIELGAIYSKLSRSEQKILTSLLSKTGNPAEFSTLISKISDSSDLFMNGKVLDFNELYALTNKEINYLPNSKNLNSFFHKSDELLYLNQNRVSKNLNETKAMQLDDTLSIWQDSSNSTITKELRQNIQEQLTSNKVPFKEKGNRFLLTSRKLKKGEVYASELERFTKRMNDLGVQVVYDPSYLKRNGMQGGYSPGQNTVYIDNNSILSNKISPVSFHEGSHAYGTERYLQGIDDDLNLIFTTTAHSPSNKVFIPSKDLLDKYQSIPYSDGFWAQESKVFSNELRQNIWSQTPNINTIRKNTETLNLINKNAIQNSQRVLDKTAELRSYIKSGQEGILNHVISIEKETIKGKTVHSFNLENFNVAIGPSTKSNIKTQIKAVTKYQKKLVKKYIKDPKNPKVLNDILNEFDLKATKYKEISLKNEQVNNKIMDKINSLTSKNKSISKNDQKELIGLTAELSKTTKTPTLSNKVFNPKPNNKSSKKVSKSSIQKKSELVGSKIKIENRSSNPNTSIEEIKTNEKIIKEKEINWAGGFEIKDGQTYPSFNHIMKGNITKGPNGPILKEGMHTDHSLALLLKKNKTYANEMLTTEGKIKSKYFRAYPNGVTEVRIPLVDKTGEIVRGSKGVKSVVKKLFPKNWTRKEIIKAVNEIKSTNKAKAYVQSDKGNVFVYEGSHKGINMRVIINTDGQLVTAYPANNIGGIRSESKISYPLPIKEEIPTPYKMAQ